MRTRIPALLVVLATAAIALPACNDPNDPRTWAKKLKNLRERKEAMDRLSNMPVETARAVLPELAALYRETRQPEHLEALVRFKDDSTKALFIEALSFSEDEFDAAVIAAGVLGEMRATDAVEDLVRAARTKLPIKSRANSARLAAIRALVKIGDKRAVPALVDILTTSADEQDFLLNQKAALGLGELRDPASVPALIKGLFMTGRGTNIFQECRLALVRMGEAAVDPLIELLEGKNLDIAAMGKKLQFDEYTPGVIPKKAAIVLGDLRYERAVPALIARLKAPAKGDERMAMLIALGQIGTADAVNTLVATLKDAKASPPDRAAAADGLYLSGDRRALPVLLDTAKNGYIKTPSGEKASDLRANAAIDFARLAGKAEYAAFKALASKETEVSGIFGEALDRMQVASECDADLACYGKTLNDQSWTRAEKAAFAIAFSGDAAKGIPLLLGALRPLATIPQDRYPVHQAILFGLTRLVAKDCPGCVEKLEQQIERDEKAVRIPGARDMLGETRVALALIQSRLGK